MYIQGEGRVGGHAYHYYSFEVSRRGAVMQLNVYSVNYPSLLFQNRLTLSFFIPTALHLAVWFSCYSI